MNKKKITVAVTGLNNTDNPGPGVPVIRALKDSEEFDFRFVGLAYENLEPGIYMNGLLDKTFMIPYPSEGTEAFMERIAEINDKEHPDLIIPNFDAELFTFMKAQDRLKEMGISTFLPTLEQYNERNKSDLPEFGKKYGLEVPQSINITSHADILRFDREKKFDYPVMVKGKFYDAYLAYNLDQVISHYNKISSKWGVPVIIQEFVKGTEVNVVALGDGKGQTIAAVPMRKQYITDKGKAWGGITLDDPEMLRLTRDIISKTQWRGGMELELIRTRNNKYYIIEINPRIPAWVYLAVGAGQNIPEALVKLALGFDVQAFSDYKKGLMFVRYSYDIICDMTTFETFSTLGEI